MSRRVGVTLISMPSLWAASLLLLGEGVVVVTGTWAHPLHRTARAASQPPCRKREVGSSRLGHPAETARSLDGPHGPAGAAAAGLLRLRLGVELFQRLLRGGSTAAGGGRRWSTQKAASDEDQVGTRTARSERNRGGRQGTGQDLRTAEPAARQGRQRRPAAVRSTAPKTTRSPSPTGSRRWSTSSRPKATRKRANTEIGERIGAVNSFIFAHEFGHALIANYGLPVLGKEEDAADAISTVAAADRPPRGRIRRRRRRVLGDLLRPPGTARGRRVRRPALARPAARLRHPLLDRRLERKVIRPKSPNSKSCPNRGWKPVRANTSSWLGEHRIRC